MIKSVIGILHLAGLLSIFSFFGDTATITGNFPAEIKAGSEFVVEITIKKGNIQGNARFIQELPVGFTAVAKKTSNGEFKFEDQKVKILWMRLPYEPEYTISYTIQVAPTVSGTFSMSGKFSYIFENKVQNAETDKVDMVVSSDEAALAQTDETSMTVLKYGNISIDKIDCIRQKPYLNDNNEVVVNLLVNKGNMDKFGKIQEQIPMGYYAVSIKSKNSIFSYKNHIVKFLWMNLPPEEQFVVTYKLIPEEAIPDKEFIIVGTFSWAENERTKIRDINERNVDLESFDSEQLIAETLTPEDIQKQELKAKQTEPAISRDKFANMQASQTQQQTQQIAANQNLPQNQNQGQVVNTQQPGQVSNNQTQSTSEVVTPQTNQQDLAQNQPDQYHLPATLTNIPQPQAGVMFRVQVAAGHRLVNQRYFKRLNVKDEINIEMHDGWHKYTIGTFEVYKDARDYRNFIWETTPIGDAFVAAYNEGQRITVQEALMIGNQKWFK